MPKDAQGLSQTRLHELLKKSKYDPTKEPPPETGILWIGEQLVGCLENFVTFVGRPGEGKTTLLRAALSSAYAPYDIWGIKMNLPPDRQHIQYYDTEQGLYHFHRLMCGAKKMMGRDNLPQQISGFLLREHDPDTMMGIIEYGIKMNPKCSVVFIDGLLDICANYNGETESKRVVEWLKRITKQYNIMGMSVLHQSKKGEFSIGHLGSAVDRAAQSIFLVQKDETKRYITLSAQKLRDNFIEFNPITITFDGTEFVQADVDMKAKKARINKPPAEFSATEHKYMISEVVPDGGVSYDAMLEGLWELNGTSKQKARGFIAYWRAQTLIFKDNANLYHRSKEAKLFIV